MNEVNLMKFFVSREEGTTSLLATALDPQLGDERQRVFRKKFCDHLSPKVILSPDDGPSVVLTEYSSMDLVMVWSEWLIVVENKVTAASVREEQLAGYYRDVLKKLGKKDRKFLGAKDQKRFEFKLDENELRKKRICIILVTPTRNLGRLGLAFSAVVGKHKRQDEKLPLSWPVILDDLSESFPCKPNDPFGKVIRDAVERTRRILEDRAEDWDYAEERNATKKFLEDVRTEVRTRLKGITPS